MGYMIYIYTTHQLVQMVSRISEPSTISLSTIFLGKRKLEHIFGKNTHGFFPLEVAVDATLPAQKKTPEHLPELQSAAWVSIYTLGNEWLERENHRFEKENHVRFKTSILGFHVIFSECSHKLELTLLVFW